MKLQYHGHDAIELSGGKVTILQIESPGVNTDFIQGMQGHNDSIRLLDDDYQELNMSRCVKWEGDLILNPEKLGSYQTALDKRIVQELSVTQREAMNELARQVFSEIQESLFEFDLPLEVRYDENLQRLYKYSRIQYLPQAINKPYGIMETDFKLHLELNDCQVLGYCNVANYLLPEQIQEFATLVQDTNVAVLLVEFSEKRETLQQLKQEIYRIDRDFDDWHN
jgi:CRISPR type II-A-associated protein Csn2